MDITKILNRVQGLLSKAEATEFPAEAETYRAKAQALMLQYRIEEEHLIAADPTSVEPIRETMTVCSPASAFRQEYVNLAFWIADHAGVRCLFGREPVDGSTTVVAYLVGYEGDIRLAEMLYAAARLVFMERIEPSVNRALDDATNIYRMRSAGITRRQVAIDLWGKDTHAAHAEVGRVYKAECAKRDETPALDGRGISARQYRTAYAEEFTYELADRLRRSRDAADRSGGVMVLHGRQERVDEAFYGHFPWCRPSTEVEPIGTKKAKKDKPAKPRKWTKADQARYDARHSTAAEAGRSAGRTAAQEVELSRTGPARVEASDGVQIVTALGYKIAE